MNNDLTISQISTIVNNVVAQATGKELTEFDTKDFITVAQIGLKTGYDTMLNSISQVLSRTIFSVRPYYAKLGRMRVSNERYGNHVRKLVTLDKEFTDNDEYKAVDGATIDDQKVNAPKVLQTNFYGQTTYHKDLTIFRDQMNVAFNGASEFGSFISMILSNASDMIEQANESTARATLANLIAGATVKVNLLEEYNKAKGLNLKVIDLMKKDNFTDFYQFAYALMKVYSNRMTERTYLYHQNLDSKNIMRHTPVQNQRMYVNNYYDEMIKSTVLSSVFHDDYLKGLQFEQVNFWQSMASPLNIKGKFTMLQSDGTLKTDSAGKTYSNIFGVLFDEEAAGYTLVNEWSATSPFNAKGGYSTINWHFTDRYWNDFTENAIVFYLEDSSPEAV